MASEKKNNIKKEIVEFPFYHYLVHFYQNNRGKVRNHYKGITKKFLDYNDPVNAKAYLRRPQFEALEIYVFLKEYLGNSYLHEIFETWYKKEGHFEGRSGAGEKDKDEALLFDQYDPEIFKTAFDNLRGFKLSYPNYIFALTMGIGKTVLMATSIFYEFLLANKFPKDPRYCHNVLVFAPDKTVLQSLKEIQAFGFSKVVPPEYENFLIKHVNFHYLDDTGVSLNTLDRSMFNIVISNTQKIILKKKHIDINNVQKFFDGTDARYKPKSIIEGYEDLYDFESEIDLITNQRFSKLTRLEQLGIYVDEAHHVFGNKLQKDMSGMDSTSLRLTINELAGHLNEAGTHVVACYNYTGTPYANNKLLPEVVYAYGLKDAINNKYLKQVTVNGYSNTKSHEFVKIALEEFWQTHQDTRYEGMLPKIALFASTIDELEKELKPAVEKVLSKHNIPLSKILINVGDERITSNDDIREFINLDSPKSEKQFILLVNKGKEGWNCRSLFGVCLYRKPKSKVFVLQATMRCLRSITDIQHSANVYLSDGNMAILESELEENFRMTVDDMNNSGDKNKDTIHVKPVYPIPQIPVKKVHRLHKIKEKELEGGIDLELDNAPYERYKVFKTQKDIKDIKKRSKEKEDYTHIKENLEFSLITLVSEISKYLNRNPIEIENLLDNSVDGKTKIVDKVNEYNELLYDWIIPKLFHELYEMQSYEHSEEEMISLVKEPPDGYYTVKSKPDLHISIDDKEYNTFKGKSFHLDNYCFDSNPEKVFYDALLEDTDNDKVYYTGMLIHGQSDFVIHYIDPESNSLRSYYPDFLSKNQDGSYSIYEVKADFMVDDTVVQAKAEYAKSMAVASGMSYQIKTQSEILGNKEGSVQMQLFFLDDYRGREFKDALPVYSLKAACGKFGEGQDVDTNKWVKVENIKGLSEGWFVAQAVGESMEPKIKSGDYCIFKPVPAGTKEGRTLLIQHRDISDPETGGSYTIKKYSREVFFDEEGNEKKKIILLPENRNFNPIELLSNDEDSFKVIGEFVRVL